MVPRGSSQVRPHLQCAGAFGAGGTRGLETREGKRGGDWQIAVDLSDARFLLEPGMDGARVRSVVFLFGAGLGRLRGSACSC